LEIFHQYFVSIPVEIAIAAPIAILSIVPQEIADTKYYFVAADNAALNISR
jgi:hypothetical protein